MLVITISTVDITVFYNGYHGDLNETFFVGEVEEGVKRLVQTTYECLMQAIDAGLCICSLGWGFPFLFHVKPVEQVAQIIDLRQSMDGILNG